MTVPEMMQVLRDHRVEVSVLADHDPEFELVRVLHELKQIEEEV